MFICVSHAPLDWELMHLNIKKIFESSRDQRTSGNPNLNKLYLEGAAESVESGPISRMFRLSPPDTDDFSKIETTVHNKYSMVLYFAGVNELRLKLTPRIGASFFVIESENAAIIK